MIDVQAIAAHYGGKVCNGNALIPTPGHSNRDRGTSIKANALAPDGVLVFCHNGTTADALAVKEMLRRDGFMISDSKRKAHSLTMKERRAIHQGDPKTGTVGTRENGDSCSGEPLEQLATGRRRAPLSGRQVH
jgi:hypothetical protein